METCIVPVTDLLLDVRNPRHEPVETQEQQIAALVKDDQVKALATDIAMNGISPIEKPIVIYDEKAGKYIVLEGNRRVCALILIHNPMLAPVGVRPAFNNMNQDKVPETIECALVKSREEARPWIERRHGGLSGGIGLKNWSPIQKTRASDAYEKPNDNSLALALFEYAKKYLHLDCSEKKASLTTATRYLGNNKFRNTIGIRSRRSNKAVRISCSHQEFEAVLYRFLCDLVENNSEKKFGVHSRTKARDIENYANHLVSEGLAPTITEKERSLEPRPKSTPAWPHLSSESEDQGRTSKQENELRKDNNPSTTTETPTTDETLNSDSSNESNTPSLNGVGSKDSTDECAINEDDEDGDPADLSHLDTSHTKKNRLPMSAKVIKKLIELDSKKLNALYKSITDIPAKKHASVLYSGVWMFCEALATRAGKDSSTELKGFFNNTIKNAFKDRGVKKEQQDAADHLTSYVNSIKHGGGYFASDSEQLAISLDTIEPTLLLMIDKAIQKRATK